MSPPVLYVDIPGFYAEVERARDPALSGRPVLVGGDPRKRGVVQSASLEAVSAGVEPGMLVTEALARCPRARLLRTNMRRYREAASQLRACLRRVEERLEPAGLGAAFLGPARSELGRRTAERLQQAVATELGLPLRVGIAPVRFLARLAAESAPAGGVVEVGPDDVSGFLHPLPVGRLPGVGPRTAARLDALGARTVGQVRALGRAVLEEALGNHGLAILEAAEGRGETRVRAAPHARSLSQESTLADPELDRPVLEERLRELAAAVGDTLRREGLAARRVAVKVRYADQETTTRSRTLGQAVEAPAEIEAVALDLLARTQAGARAVRLVGLSLSSLAPSRRDDRQLELFPQA